MMEITAEPMLLFYIMMDMEIAAEAMLLLCMLGLFMIDMEVEAMLLLYKLG